MSTPYAYISEDGLYRYTLGRNWGSDRPAVFIMLNPSTADAALDDPTIRRCIGFAKALGAGGIHVINLYAFRATKPTDLWKASDPVGPENNGIITDSVRAAVTSGAPVIAAWGANAKPDRVAEVLALPLMNNLTALGVTNAGAPRHPLYLPSAARPVAWSA